MTADEYARRVEFALRDLPWRQRRDLVADLREHLAELPAGTNFYDSLGRPEQYGAEMRAAAGLERRRGPIAFLRARRPRNLVLTALGLTVLGLAIGTLAWIHSYQPIDFGNLSGYPKHSVEAPGGDSTSVVVRQGRPFSLAIEIRNYGRYAVRILGVPQYGSWPLRARVLMYPPTSYGGASVRRPRPFRPFNLEPGKFDILVLQGVYRCGPSWKSLSGETFMYDLPVRYGFLWRTATASIPLPMKLVFVYKKNVSCRSN